MAVPRAAAEAVKGFAVLGPTGLADLLFGEALLGAIHRRQPDPCGALRAQLDVKLLCAAK